MGQDGARYATQVPEVLHNNNNNNNNSTYPTAVPILRHFTPTGFYRGSGTVALRPCSTADGPFQGSQIFKLLRPTTIIPVVRDFRAGWRIAGCEFQMSEPVHVNNNVACFVGR